MEVLTRHETHCPYCGEGIELLIDCSVMQQEYIEDCQVCCQPIIVNADVDAASGVHVRVRREDD